MEEASAMRQVPYSSGKKLASVVEHVPRHGAETDCIAIGSEKKEVSLYTARAEWAMLLLVDHFRVEGTDAQAAWVDPDVSRP